MYVPPSVFVGSAIGSALVNLIFSLVPFAILAWVTGVEPSLWWLFLIVPCFLVTLFAFGVGLILSSMAVYFTDTVEIWAVLLSVYFYLTPVIYPATQLGPIVFALEQYNPMYLFLNIARTVVIDGTAPALDQLAWATGFAVAAFVDWMARLYPIGVTVCLPSMTTFPPPRMLRRHRTANAHAQPLSLFDSEAAISVADVTVRYRMPTERINTLKERVVRGITRRSVGYTEFTALSHINLQVKRGEAVALIGRNGAGKSTLLKVIARVQEPTCGTCMGARPGRAND